MKMDIQIKSRESWRYDHNIIEERIYGKENHENMITTS
jgi:hypothetical protein